MRILKITTTFPLRQGEATPSFVLDYAQRLTAAEHEVIVLAPHAPMAKTREHFGEIETRRFRYFFPTRKQRLAYAGGIAANVRASFLAKIQVPFLFAFMMLAALRTVRETRPDIIHAHWAVPSGFVGAFVSRLTKTPLVVTIHGSDITALEILPIRRQMAAYLVGASRRTITVSLALKNRLLKILGPAGAELERKMATMPMGIDFSRLATVSPLPSEGFVAFLGRLVPGKGVDVLIHSIAIASKRSFPLHLEIYGVGPEMETLRAEAKKLGMEENVVFRGWIGPEEKVNLLARRPILVIPSTGQEGVPVTLLEGMASGCAVVCSRVGGIPEIIDDAVEGHLVDPGDAHQLADVLVRLLSSPDEREGLGRAAQSKAKEFDWVEIVRRTLTYYAV